MFQHWLPSFWWHILGMKETHNEEPIEANIFMALKKRVRVMQQILWWTYYQLSLYLCRKICSSTGEHQAETGLQEGVFQTGWRKIRNYLKMSTAVSWKNRWTVMFVYSSFCFGKPSPTKHAEHDFYLCLSVINTPGQNYSWHKSAWLQWSNTKLQQGRIWPHRNVVCPLCGILLVLKAIFHLSSVHGTILLLL